MTLQNLVYNRPKDRPETSRRCMDVRLPTNHLFKRLLIVLYCCLSFVFICALYSWNNSKHFLEHEASIVIGTLPDGTVRLSNDLFSPNASKSSLATTILPPPAETPKVASVQTKDEVPITNQSLSEPTCMVGGKPKLILQWTSFFDSWKYLPSGPFLGCRGCQNCITTNNRSRLMESDAVIFHCRDMTLTDLPLTRLPHQRWVFYCLESPPYSDFPGLRFMYQMFNWTMSYRLDSDIVTKYGSFKKVYPTRKLDYVSLRDNWQGKSKSVVWMSSHCPTHGGRDAFVSQLKRYIDVDEFGSCGSLDCPKDSTNKCLGSFARTYKFFLAFENSICKDYITEKFYRTLQYDVIPVVFGGAQYEKFAPPGSYVDALAFKSPKHLAYFLKGVGGDFALYRKYFEWRGEFAVNLDNNKECALCSLLHDRTASTQIYDDMELWWHERSPCRTWKQRS